jgi:hypothetical protein
MSPDERDEQLMQEYLDGDSELSRLYRRGAGETPGAQLDARILGEARRAVTPAPRVVYSPFARHWLVPTSLAAVFVLSVSVVLLMPEPLDGPGMGVDDGNGHAPALGGGLRDTLGDRTDTEAAPAAPAPMESDTRREPATRLQDSDAGGRASGTSPLPSASRPQQAGETVGTSVKKRKSEAAERKGDAAREAAPAPEAGAGPVLQAPPAALEESDALPARAQGVLPAASVRNDPEAWISFIEALLDARDETGAQQSLREFRRRYPDFPLPADLRALTDSPDAQPP